MGSVRSGRLGVGPVVVITALLITSCAEPDGDSVLPGTAAQVPATTTGPTLSSPTALDDLDEFDLRKIFAVAAANRLQGFLEVDTSVTADVVDSVGHVFEAEGLIHFFEHSAKFSAGDRSAIAAALAPLEVRFVSPSVRDDPGYATADVVPNGNVVLSIAAPVSRGGQLTITTEMWCGTLCARGGASGLSRGEDGTWVITGPVGSEWVA